MSVHDAEFAKKQAFVLCLEADDPVVRGLDKKARQLGLGTETLAKRALIESVREIEDAKETRSVSYHGNFGH